MLDNKTIAALFVGGAILLVSTQKAKGKSNAKPVPYIPTLPPIPTLPSGNIPNNNSNNNLPQWIDIYSTNVQPSTSNLPSLMLHEFVEPFVLRNDNAGGGNWLDSRTGEVKETTPQVCRRGKNRLHCGIDILVTPNQIIESPLEGKVVKIGKPYSGDNFYKYVRIKGTGLYENIRTTQMYVNPLVKVGDYVAMGQPIGTAQDVSLKYGSTMLPHIHYEVDVRNCKVCLWNRVNPLIFYDV